MLWSMDSRGGSCVWHWDFGSQPFESCGSLCGFLVSAIYRAASHECLIGFQSGKFEVCQWEVLFCEGFFSCMFWFLDRKQKERTGKRSCIRDGFLYFISMKIQHIFNPLHVFIQYGSKNVGPQVSCHSVKTDVSWKVFSLPVHWSYSSHLWPWGLGSELWSNRSGHRQMQTKWAFFTDWRCPLEIRFNAQLPRRRLNVQSLLPHIENG